VDDFRTELYRPNLNMTSKGNYHSFRQEPRLQKKATAQIDGDDNLITSNVSGISPTVKVLKSRIDQEHDVSHISFESSSLNHLNHDLNSPPEVGSPENDFV